MVKKESEAGVRTVQTRRLGEQIKDIRRSKFWTQADLGREAGMSYSQVSKVEQGYPCTFRTLSNILDALGYEIDLVRTPVPAVLEEPQW